MRISIPDIKAIQLRARALLVGKLRAVRPRHFCLALAGFACATILSVSSFAQANPLSFGDNFFVTGDYVVAGAHGMTTASNGYAVGTFTIPDTNPGIHGITSVPPGAEVVAALLYWQTVENAGTVPGQPGTGENGFFRPIIKNGPAAPGYPITGVSLPGHNNVSWSSGGCSEPQTGKITRTYRANVLGAFPQDAKGNVLADGQFEVRLPSVGPQTPLTLGATLVIIYRILSPSVPLNSIVIYDGAFGQNDVSLNMTQTVQGFYDAGANSGAPFVSKLTLIAGAGKSNKSQTVYLNNVALPSHTGRNVPPFPGYYGTWDNPTWTFGDATYPEIANPVPADAPSATTEVVPAANGPGCLSWGAVIFSTTVNEPDGDGLLKAWKTSNPPGYCDASINGGVCNKGSNSDPAWVALPGAMPGEKDLFIQLDYMCSKTTGVDSCTTNDGTNYSFDPRPSGAAALMTSAFSANGHGVHVHINPVSNTGIIQPVHAIQEQTCADVKSPALALCPFPDQAGVVGWKGGYAYFKNQLVETGSGNILNCLAANPPADCQPRFQHGRKDSWHYALFAHAVGRTEWKIQDGSLKSVVQSGHSVTFTTSTPLGTLTNGGYDSHSHILSDPTCANGRLSVYYAATNTNLNGTFCIANYNTNSDTFTITVPGPSVSATYTLLTDPYFSVAPGQTSSASGISDVGGSDSLITLGLWGDPTLSSSNGQKENTIAGTFMHETGHSLGLTHGGFYYDTAGSFVPTIEPNCKPNFQSVMNYFFQVDLLADSQGNPVLDYSEQPLDPLNENSLAAGVTFGGAPLMLYPSTKWYTPNQPNNTGSPVATHCDGTPAATPAYLVPGPADPTFPAWNTPIQDVDVDFDGITGQNLRGYNDWTPGAEQGGITTGIDLRQIGATGNSAVFSQDNFFGGGQPLNGGGQPLNGGGQPLNGGGQPLNGGGQPLNGGGQPLNGGGQPLNGGGEIDQKDADSYTRPPTLKSVTEGTSPRTITLTWLAPTFGQIGMYKVYRSEAGGAFIPVTLNPPNALTGNPPPLTYTDTVACDPNGYRYFVTALLSSTSTNPFQESVPSNIGTLSGNTTEPLTGCYTNASPGTVTLNDLAFTDTTSPNAPMPVQGDNIQITWSLKTDDTGVAVTRAAASTALVAIGPIPFTGMCPANPPEFLGYSGTYPYPATSLPITGNGPFSATWNTTNFNAGCYFFELDLDSHQYEQSTALGLDIFVSNNTPHILPTPLPNGVVGSGYSDTINESGGTVTSNPFIWTVVPGSVTPGPSLPGISFQPNAVGVTSGTLSGLPCQAGSYSFTAKVTDSAGNFGTQGLMLQIQQAYTTTAVVSSLNASTYGQSVTFTATVTPQYSCTPTGKVTFYDGPTAISGAITLSNAATAMFTTTATLLTAGTHSITAVYSGDSNFYATGSGGSTATVLSQNVNQATTTTSVVSSLSPSTYGQMVAFTARVTREYAGTPTGSVTFYDGATAISAAMMLSNTGTATINLQLPAGGHSITAVYGGDMNFYATNVGGSTATALPQTVIQATTTTSVTSSINSSTYGQTVIFTATVAPQYYGTPTMSVTFYDGMMPISGAMTLSSATASFTTMATQLTVGQHSITAVYGGDPNFYATGSGGSTASPLTQAVNPAQLTATVSGNESNTPPTFTVTGISYATFAGSDTASSAVNGTLSCAVVVPPGGGTPGSNPIFCTGLSAENYNISYGYGGLSPIAAATPAPLTVNVIGSVQTGGGSPAFTLTSYTFTGFTGSDTSSIVTGTLSCAPLALKDSSGNYPISCTGLSATGYNISYSYSYGASNATAPTPLTVAVNGAVQTGGGSPTFTVNSLTYSGFINTDTISVVNGTLSCSLGAEVPPNYPISCLGLTAANYNVSYDFSASPGTILARPSPLIVTVTGTPPTVTYAVSGLVNNDFPTVVGGTLACTAGTADGAGNVPISCTGLSATNYTIAYSYSYSPGLDTTNGQAPLTVNVIGTVPHGSTDKVPTPPLTITSVTYSGFVNDDTLSAVTGVLSCTTQPGPNAIPPSFVISGCSGITVPGYYGTIKYWFGKVTVAP